MQWQMLFLYRLLMMQKVKKTFPVFTELDLMENGYLEATFVCREEDVRAIQVILAAYV